MAPNYYEIRAFIPMNSCSLVSREMHKFAQQNVRWTVRGDILGYPYLVSCEQFPVYTCRDDMNDLADRIRDLLGADDRVIDSEIMLLAKRGVDKQRVRRVIYKRLVSDPRPRFTLKNLLCPCIWPNAYAANEVVRNRP